MAKCSPIRPKPVMTSTATRRKPHRSATARSPAQLIAVAEAEHGPVTNEEIQALRDQLQRARHEQTEQTQGGANAP